MNSGISGTQRFPLFLWVLLTAALALAGCQHSRVLHEAQTVAVPVNVAAGTKGLKNEERFPTGTMFVTHQGGRTYFATDKYFAVRGPGNHPAITVPDGSPSSVAFSPDGRRILIQHGDQVSVVRASDLGLLNIMPMRTDAQVWWAGDRVGYLDGYNGVLRTATRQVPVIYGKAEVAAADPSGRYFLIVRQIRPGTRQNEGVPTNALELWRVTPQGRLTRVRRLAVDAFDGASLGDPCHLAALNPQTVVFGEPLGGAVWYDSIWVYRDGHTAEVTSNVRRVTNYGPVVLEFAETPPLETPHAIYGLTDWFNDFDTPKRSPLPKYMYRVTTAGVRLRQIPQNTLFLTYDPSRGGLGLAHPIPGGIIVRYGPAGV